MIITVTQGHEQWHRKLGRPIMILNFGLKPSLELNWSQMQSHSLHPAKKWDKRATENSRKLTSKHAVQDCHLQQQTCENTLAASKESLESIKAEFNRISFTTKQMTKPSPHHQNGGECRAAVQVSCNSCGNRTHPSKTKAQTLVET